jgi:hypothetical protein
MRPPPPLAEREIKLLGDGEQPSLSQWGWCLRLELGLLLGPIRLGSQDPVQQILGHWLAAPLLGRDARRVNQRLPFVLKVDVSPMLRIVESTKFNIPPSS